MGETMLQDLSGSYDNFLQIWLEQTEEDLHRDKGGFQHDHIHIKVNVLKDSDNRIALKIYRGRNNAEFIEDIEIEIVKRGESWITSDGRFSITDEAIVMNRLGSLDEQNEEPYKLIKCRYFSGFIEYPLPEDPDTIHRLGNLETHDQGGMVELEYEKVTYTVELTQLIFAHKIKLMKVAIYDLPLVEVGINSKAISYAWTSPDCKRLGINVRKIITGWTFIEEGFLSSNNLNIVKE